MPRLLPLLFIVGALWCSRLGAAAPVQFTFRLAPGAQANPFARDVWAEVTLPSGQVQRLPAFYDGDDRFAVRARAVAPGEYRLGQVTEKSAAGETAPAFTSVSSSQLTVDAPATLPQVGLANVDHSRFVFKGSGVPYTPIGSNIAWAGQGGTVEYYERALPQFSREGLNWIRIWMCHWGGLNLDWLDKSAGVSPPPGRLDLRVAQDWDRVVAAAEQSGVYIQLVLQHHGQLSSAVNPNWEINPWNAANPGGFLQEPKEFFTAPTALEATRLKYRYIAARWGYSPAILAWELFNEVHWIDPIRRDKDEALVARWHADMAAHLRAHDPFGHLVTTSLENLRSEIYAAMDYYQPHLYPYSILAGPLSFNVPFAALKRPVFYGETGDDHAPLTYEQKQSGIAIVPPVWASLMGPAHYPAQPWLGDDLIRKNRLSELGAVARFLHATRLGEQPGLKPFSPRLVGCGNISLVIESGQVWQRRPAPELDLPLDGRMPVGLADIPRAYVGSPNSLADGLPGRATYQINTPREIKTVARISAVGSQGSAIRISAGEKIFLEKTWEPKAADAPNGDRPAELAFTIPAGRHTLVVENPGAEDWFQLDQLATDRPVPVLAALGKRSDDFIAVWVWHREGVFALKETKPETGTLLLDDVPAGQWTVTWWDTIKGVPLPAGIITHRGGELTLTTPMLSRHAAVVLMR